METMRTRILQGTAIALFLSLTLSLGTRYATAKEGKHPAGILFPVGICLALARLAARQRN